MNERIEILIIETFNLNSQVTRSQDDYEYTLLDDYSKMNNYQKSMLKSSMELMNKGVSLLLSPLI